MTKHTEEFSHLTFSQREGLVPIPGPLELGSLPDDPRYELWKAFEDTFVTKEIYNIEGDYVSSEIISPKFFHSLRKLIVKYLERHFIKSIG